MNVTITNALQLAGVTRMADDYRARTGETLTDEEYLQSQVEAVCLGYASAYKIGVISSGDYVLRFTAAENAAITAAAETDPLIAGLLARVRESAEVVLYADEVQQGIGYLVSEGLLTQARADVILAY